jgi:superfamily II DNA or RNA helicase
MAAFRLAAGRVVAPLVRPKIFGAHVLFPPVPFVAFPDTPDLRLLPDEEPRAQDLGPRWLSTEPLSVEAFEPVPIFDLQAIFPPPETPVPWLEAFSLPSPAGGSYPATEEKAAQAPPPLPKAFLAVQQEDRLVPAGGPPYMDWLKPYLEPAPALDQKSVLIGFPRTLRPYQVEAVKALLSHEGYLLADDLGTGKTVAVCTALQSLFQYRKLRRALIVCLEGRRRHWVRHLDTWSPGLVLTVVYGDLAQRRLDWIMPAHVYLTDYQTLAEDIENGALSGDDLAFDLVVFDDAHTLHTRPSQRLPAFQRLSAKQRWGLTGVAPREAEAWLSIFTILTPDRARGGADITLPDLRHRFLPFTLHRTKADLASQLPRIARTELWVDLDPRQAKAYEAVLAHEQNRLIELGGAATPSHVEAAVARLKQVCNFAPDLLDGAKVRLLLNLVEEISAIGAKVVVFSQFRQEGLDRLQRALEPYGTMRLDSSLPEADRGQAMWLFRSNAEKHVLLMDSEMRPEGGPLTEASYIIHFDHGWNSAVRRRAEMRLHPDPGPAVAVNIFEFWVADTIDARLHNLLADRNLLPADISPDTRPAHLDDRLTLDDWTGEILETKDKVRTSLDPILVLPGTRQLPPADVQRQQLAAMLADELIANVGRFMLVLGFTNTEPLTEPSETGGDLQAWRLSEGEREHALVRCVRAVKDVGVGEGRRLLADLEARSGFRSAYLITTADFTPSCKRLAEESQGKLTLVSGAELYRHLHILGAVDASR